MRSIPRCITLKVPVTKSLSLSSVLNFDLPCTFVELQYIKRYWYLSGWGGKKKKKKSHFLFQTINVIKINGITECLVN